MIKRIKRLIEEAHFARHSSEIELNVTESSYHNALLVEQLKEDTVNDAIKYMIVDLVKIKQTYPKANHYTYAYLYGPHGEQQGASDDGEPSRTAGIPILEVLKHHDVTNVIGVVVRYFGGIKLGAGGLVRAYTKAIADAIKDAKFYEKKIVECYEISFPYHLTHKIDQMEPNDIKILHKDFM